jgi:hypothetical protein
MAESNPFGIIAASFSPTDRLPERCWLGVLAGLFTARLYVLDPRFALFANLISHETASERERPRSRRRLGPQKLAWYWRKTEGTFDGQASLVFGRQRTAEGGKGTDVSPAGRVHPGEAASEQKQGEIDCKRSAISVIDQRLTIAVCHDRRWWGRRQRRSPDSAEQRAKCGRLSLRFATGISNQAALRPNCLRSSFPAAQLLPFSAW